VGLEDPYPYHILGSQGLSWVRRAPISDSARRRDFGRLLRIVTDGLKNHPRDKGLAQLAEDLEREYLLTVAVDQ
jgi:hypothetical protein